MKRFSAALILFVITISGLQAQKSFPTYYDLSNLMHTSPGAFKYGLYGFDNPAITSYLQEPDMLLAFNDRMGSAMDFNQWGIFTGTPYFGFGALTDKQDGYGVTEYRISEAFGDRNFSLGTSYGFVGGDKSYFKRSNTISIGTLIRPGPYFSIGVHHTWALDNLDKETVFDLDVRPFKNYPLTFFYDFAMYDYKPKTGYHSGGVSWEILDGIRIDARYFENRSFAVGVDLSLGTYGVASQAFYDQNSKYGYNSYSIRLGARDRTVTDMSAFAPAKKWLKLDLNGTIKYQRHEWFDNSLSLLGILKTIDMAKKDETIGGIVLNATNLSASSEIMWEIRDKLAEFKRAGKKVYIFIDRLGIEEYHFASVADKIIMDEMGSVSLTGYAMGRSFYKNMMAKVGIGCEELRYFKYKSAMESFSRDKMSEADRQQRQKLINDFYDNTREEICDARGFSHDQFDEIVNGAIIYTAKEAKEKKLIDATGRWNDLDEDMKKIDWKSPIMIPQMLLTENVMPVDDKWGENAKRIAIIYAIGDCAMDQGIKARSLVRDVLAAVNDGSISAIVLRVDSPGGDAMASDYIAEVIRANKGKKPIIVSQGQVAASGGYWLSMYGDKIVAAPGTITGSIGVIGAWFYDKGLKDTLGITTDYVKVGKYADLGLGFSLPFIGIGLPVRNLNQDEKSQMEKNIRGLYADFIGKVAVGRKMKSEEVDSIAQGHVYSGTEGKKLGLVDEIGGMYKAIEIAKQAANISPNEKLELVEMPNLSLFDFSALFTQLVGINLNVVDDKVQSLIFRLKNNGVAMPVLPLDYYDYQANY